MIENRPAHTIRTIIPNVYDKLVTEEELFLKKHHLFVAGLVYGMLYDKQYQKPPNSQYTDIVKLGAVGDKLTNEIINLVFAILDDRKGQSQTWSVMLRMADWGVSSLDDIYERHNNFTIPALVKVAQQRWPKRIKDLGLLSYHEP